MKRLKRFNEAQLPYDDHGDYQDYDDWDDDGDDDGDDDDNYGRSNNPKGGTWDKLLNDMDSGIITQIGCNSNDLYDALADDDINTHELISKEKNEIKNGLYSGGDFIIVFNGNAPVAVIFGYNPSPYVFKDTLIVLSSYDFYNEIVCYDKPSSEFEINRIEGETSNIKKIKTNTSEDITWSELLDKIDSEDIKLINCKKNQIRKMIPENILNDVIVGKSKKGKSQIKNYTLFSNGIAIIFDYDGIPEAVTVTTTEKSESILFKDIIIITHEEDGIICYDRISGDSEQLDWKSKDNGNKKKSWGFTA